MGKGYSISEITEVRLIQLLNVLYFPNDTTEFGIVIEDNEIHPEKAALPIVFTELGISILSNFLQL